MYRGQSYQRIHKCGKNLVSSNFKIYSVLKTVSSSSHLLDTASQEIKKLSHDEDLIICSGTNDLVNNIFTLAFQNISNMVTKNNHTNIIPVNIPYRYHTANTSAVNEGIEKFSKKLTYLLTYSMVQSPS